jgi:hypothetical protein
MAESRDSVSPRATKKKYAAPCLVTYGAASDLTQASTGGGAKNDHIGGNFKTH